jgi:hypothetical protein
MIDWIMKNREWLFSGVGVAIVGGLIALILNYFRKQASPPTAQSYSSPRGRTGRSVLPFDPGKYSPSPLPREIASELDSAPPFQRSAKASSYTGLKVQWLTTLQFVYDLGDGKVQISLTDPRGRPWIRCDDIDVNLYPRLKIAHAGTRIWVAGTIGPEYAGGIILILDNVVFPDPA